MFLSAITSILLSGSLLGIQNDLNFLVSANVVGDQLDFLVPGGAHITVRCSNWTVTDQTTIDEIFTSYLPYFYSQFWKITQNATITIVISDSLPGGVAGYASGYPVYDEQGNVTGYEGTIAVGPNVTVDGGILHELIHVFQFWIPNYFRIVGDHIEAIDDAFGVSIRAQQNQINPFAGDACYGSELFLPEYYGRASFAYSMVSGSYMFYKGWLDLYYYDSTVFRKMNDFIAEIPENSTIGIRDILKETVFAGQMDYCFSGYSLDEWLDGFSIFNFPSDVPNGRYVWLSGRLDNDPFPCAVRIYVISKETDRTASFVGNWTYDISIRDGVSRKLVYSNINQSPNQFWAQQNVHYVYDWTLVSDSSFNLLRVDVTVHLDSEDIPATVYLSKSNQTGPMAPDGVKSIVFLNRDGYAEGTGLSNVGFVNGGMVFWKDGDSVEATVTSSIGTYSYCIDNIIASPYHSMSQIGVKLYEAKVFMAPLIQEVAVGVPFQLQVYVSPKSSSGGVQLYSSRDKVNWVLFSTEPLVNGSSSFSVSLSQEGRHFFKASWTGDGTIDPSNSSVVEVATPDEHELIISVSGSGSTSPAAGSLEREEGSEVAVTAYPSSGWTFSHWLLDSVNVGDAIPYTVTMNADHTLTAVFTEIPSFEVTTFVVVVESNTYVIETCSNSSVSNLFFDSSLKRIRFNVDGTSETTGLCNITIPTELLSGDFTIYRDDALLVKNVDYTETYNGTHCLFSITYEHNTHMIDIIATNVIPEFHSWIILPLVLLASVIATVYRKKPRKS